MVGGQVVGLFISCWLSLFNCSLLLRQQTDFPLTIADVQQEKEDSKRRCDWAFTERDKIVRERESIRTLCDKLRHERDSAVSKLIEALRDTDELKKQKSDALKQLKEVK